MCGIGFAQDGQEWNCPDCWDKSLEYISGQSCLPSPNAIYTETVTPIQETLRDKIAMAALTSLLSNHEYDLSPDVLAEVVYEIADAMIEARNTSIESE